MEAIKAIAFPHPEDDYMGLSPIESTKLFNLKAYGMEVTAIV